jgi:hypothetical protein
MSFQRAMSLVAWTNRGARHRCGAWSSLVRPWDEDLLGGLGEHLREAREHLRRASALAPLCEHLLARLGPMHHRRCGGRGWRRDGGWRQRHARVAWQGQRRSHAALGLASGRAPEVAGEQIGASERI